MGGTYYWQKQVSGKSVTRVFHLLADGGDSIKILLILLSEPTCQGAVGRAEPFSLNGLFHEDAGQNVRYRHR